MASSSSVFTNQRAQAGLCWIAAAELLALILQLAGAIPYVGMLDTVLSVADGRVRRMKHDMLQSVARKHHGGVDHLEQNGDQGPDAGTQLVEQDSKDCQNQNRGGFQNFSLVTHDLDVTVFDASNTIIDQGSVTASDDGSIDVDIDTSGGSYTSGTYWVLATYTYWGARHDPADPLRILCDFCPTKTVPLADSLTFTIH